MQTKDKHGHDLLEGKPIHKSDGKVTEVVKGGRHGQAYEITHCVHCQARMSKPKK